MKDVDTSLSVKKQLMNYLIREKAGRERERDM